MAEEDNQSLYNENNENNHVRTLRDHMNPTRISAPSCIFFPPDTSHFNFKPDIIQLLPSFQKILPKKITNHFIMRIMRIIELEH